MATHISAVMVAATLGSLAQEHQAVLEIHSGRHALQRQAKLNHGERDIGLDPHHHRLRAAQSCRLSNATERTGRERVKDVERRDVNDDAPGPEAPYALGELVAQ